jgi:hypothetical protein
VSDQELTEPATYDETIAISVAEQWRFAMDEEILNMGMHGTYELVDKPAGRKIVWCKWVYKLKRDAKGYIERFRARLVATGYSQVAGIDYEEEHTPPQSIYY